MNEEYANKRYTNMWSVEFRAKTKTFLKFDEALSFAVNYYGLDGSVLRTRIPEGQKFFACGKELVEIYPEAI